MAELDLDWSGLEILKFEECFDLLRSTPVGRLGFVDHGEPAILPVNYALDGRSVVFRTAHGSKLSSAMLQRPVCLEVDEWDATDHTGWSVLVRGIADEVLDDELIDHYLSLPVLPWTRPDLRHHWIRVMTEEVTGRRIVASGSSG